MSGLQMNDRLTYADHDDLLSPGRHERGRGPHRAPHPRPDLQRGCGNLRDFHRDPNPSRGRAAGACAVRVAGSADLQTCQICGDYTERAAPRLSGIAAGLLLTWVVIAFAGIAIFSRERTTWQQSTKQSTRQWRRSRRLASPNQQGQHGRPRQSGFRGIEAAMNEMSGVLIKCGITVTPSRPRTVFTGARQGGSRQVHALLHPARRVHFSAADGSSVTSAVYGEAMDSGDKAVVKAQSVAFRTALFQQFVIPTMAIDPEAGGDDDSGEGPGRRCTRRGRSGHGCHQAHWKGLDAGRGARRSRSIVTAELAAIATEADRGAAVVKISTYDQGTPEWHAARCGIASTASGFADVLATVNTGEAASRRNYRARLVVERLTGASRQQDLSDASRCARARARGRSPARLRIQTGALVRARSALSARRTRSRREPGGLIDDDGGSSKSSAGVGNANCLPAHPRRPDRVHRADSGLKPPCGSPGAWWGLRSFNPDFPANLH